MSIAELDDRRERLPVSIGEVTSQLVEVADLPHLPGWRLVGALMATIADWPRAGG
jgi:hypothetical protein